jgi:hypothetical protein
MVLQTPCGMMISAFSFNGGNEQDDKKKKKSSDARHRARATRHKEACIG